MKFVAKTGTDGFRVYQRDGLKRRKFFVHEGLMDWRIILQYEDPKGRRLAEASFFYSKETGRLIHLGIFAQGSNMGYNGPTPFYLVSGDAHEEHYSLLPELAAKKQVVKTIWSECDVSVMRITETGAYVLTVKRAAKDTPRLRQRRHPGDRIGEYYPVQMVIGAGETIDLAAMQRLFDQAHLLPMTVFKEKSKDGYDFSTTKPFEAASLEESTRVWGLNQGYSKGARAYKG